MTESEKLKLLRRMAYGEIDVQVPERTAWRIAGQIAKALLIVMRDSANKVTPSSR